MVSPYLTVLIPAFNEETNLRSTLQVLAETLPAHVRSFELLIVDDASRDRTGALADQLAAEDSRVRVVHHPENRGIGGAFVTGVAHARGDWLILIPADLALDPADLVKYFQAARKADIVVGLRSDKRDYTPFRRLVSWINIRLVQTLFDMPLHQFQYISLYRTQILRDVSIEFCNSAFFFPEILIKARARGYRLTEVDIRYLPRASGRATGARFSMIWGSLRDLLGFWRRGDWRR